VTSARLQADLTGGGGVADVRVEYALSGVAPGDSVAVTLLDYGLAMPTHVRAGEAGEAASVPVVLGAARRARLAVERAPDGGARLVVAYQVPLPAEGDGGGAVAHLPILTVDGASEAATPELFQAEVRVPSGWTVTEAFPTGLVPVGSESALHAELPVVPSVVTLRFRTRAAGGVPLPVVLNAVALACIALVGIAGWRQLAPRRP
jgi:hypothetical protein